MASTDVSDIWLVQMCLLYGFYRCVWYMAITDVYGIWLL